MELTLDETTIAQLHHAEVDVTVHVKARINVTAFVARQKVNVWLLDKVGTGLLSEKPSLVAANGRLYWRVPVVLSLPGHGRLGQVGSVDVDVQTAELLADQSLIEQITQNAIQFTQRASL
jgi:hypothetical protein